MYNVKQGGTIQRGDLIAIANGNDLDVAIYFGQGRGGTVQYFSPDGVVKSKEWWEAAQKSTAFAENNKPWKLTRIWKHYLQTPRETRIHGTDRYAVAAKKIIYRIKLT